MIKGKALNILLGISFALFLFGSGYKLGEFKAIQSKFKQIGSSYSTGKSFNDISGKKADFDLFFETWNKVEEKFIDKKKLNPEKMFYGAIRGLVASLDDPYTFFLTPEENKQSKDDLGGKFEGIGAQLGLKNNRIVVIAPLKNSPAEQAGIQAGDFIVKVDGQLTRNWSLPQAVSKIRGEKGTKVTLTLLRNDKEFDVSIVRDQIIVSSVDLTFEKQVAHLKINQFGENTNTEWDNAVAQIKQQWDNRTIKGLVLDLRDNPGGFLESSVYVASEFIPQNKLIVKQESTVSDPKEYFVDRKGSLLDIPIIVLINKGSASASEILAGSLRDHKRATLMGEKSFGKGSVQEALDLKSGAGLHVTIARWVLPAGDWINGKGIEPQIKVENKVNEGNTLTRQQDTQLEKAIEKLLQ